MSDFLHGLHDADRTGSGSTGAEAAGSDSPADAELRDQLTRLAASKGDRKSVV